VPAKFAVPAATMLCIAVCAALSVTSVHARGTLMLTTFPVEVLNFRIKRFLDVVCAINFTSFHVGIFANGAFAGFGFTCVSSFPLPRNVRRLLSGRFCEDC